MLLSKSNYRKITDLHFWKNIELDTHTLCKKIKMVITNLKFKLSCFSFGVNETLIFQNMLNLNFV